VIPAGQYGAGEMIVWDCGVYSPDEGNQYWFHDHAAAERRAREGLEKGKLGFFLCGEKVKGSFALVRMADRKNWLLIKHKDRFVATTDLTALERSVLSALTLEDVKAVRLERLAAERLAPSGRRSRCRRRSRRCTPSLARQHSTTPTGCGSRSSTATARLRYHDKGVTLKSRRGLSSARSRGSRRIWRSRRCRAWCSMATRGVRRGRQAFFQRDAERAAQHALVFYCFDLLHFAGLNLRKAPYRDRRRWLAQCILP